MGHNCVVRWVEDFLRGRRQYVVIGDKRSDCCEVRSGVPQGSVLGPLLFLIYINDMIRDSPVKARLFADDCIIYHEIRSVKDQIQLNDYLLQIDNWCTEWQMSLNPHKTVCMTITHKLEPLNYVYNLQGNPLSRVTEYKYLGVTITSNLSWAKHIDNIVAKGNKRLGYIRRVLKQASTDTKLTAYKMLVRPLLDYACEIWDPYHKKSVSKLEQIQRRALRFIFSRYRRLDSVTPLYAQADVPLLSHRRKEKRLTLFYCVINGLVLVKKEQYINEAKTRVTRNKHNKHVQVEKFLKTVLNTLFFLPHRPIGTAFLTTL